MWCCDPQSFWSAQQIGCAQRIILSQSALSTFLHCKFFIVIWLEYFWNGKLSNPIILKKICFQKDTIILIFLDQSPLEWMLIQINWKLNNNNNLKFNIFFSKYLFAKQTRIKISIDYVLINSNLFLILVSQVIWFKFLIKLY